MRRRQPGPWLSLPAIWSVNRASSRRRKTYQNEDPAPAPLPHNTGHVSNPLCKRGSASSLLHIIQVGGAHVGQDAAKGPREGGSTEEQRDAELPFPSLVPHREVVHDAGEKTGLGNAQEKAGNKESRQVLDDTHERSDDSPRDGQRWEPEPRSCPLEDNVAGNLRGSSSAYRRLSDGKG